MEKLRTQFYKYYIGLNRRAPDVVSRNEVGRFSLKLNIYTYTRKLKFWIHLENLPENSIAKQCLQLSSQLAEHKKTLLYIFFKWILQIYGCTNRERIQIVHHVVDYNAQTVATNLPKIKQNIMIALKNHQFDMIQSDRKLQFYSIFKTDQSISLQLELIKNIFHRQSVAKLRSGNHDLRIETGRHCVLKIRELKPKNLPKLFV